MKKGKSITLLTILSILMAFLLVITFAQFDLGVKRFNSVLGAIELDYDISGGYAYTYKISRDNIEEVGDNIDDVVKTVGNRMTALGYQTHSVKAVKSTDADVLDYNIVIEAKAPVNDRNEDDQSTLASDISVAMAFGELKFYGDTSADTVDSKEILTDGKVVKIAKALPAIANGEDVSYPISIELTDYAYNELINSIKDNNDKYYLKVKLGDTTLLDLSTEQNYLSSAYFNQRAINLYASSEIFAKQSALQISSGGLAYKYEFEDSKVISAPLGNNIPLMTVIGISALIVVAIIALVILYKAYGVVFSLSLIFFILLETLMLIAVPGIKLSLGGIVGILLSLVLVCDGFVIIIKRIKEEFLMGKTLKSAVAQGYRRALIPIISTCVISGVIALALFAFTSGALQCFGITFGIGAVLSAIITLLVSKLYSAIILSLVKYNEKAVNFKRMEE